MVIVAPPISAPVASCTPPGMAAGLRQQRRRGRQRKTQKYANALEHLIPPPKFCSVAGV
jgi:hypothetical protein